MISSWVNPFKQYFFLNWFYMQFSFFGIAVCPNFPFLKSQKRVFTRHRLWKMGSFEKDHTVLYCDEVKKHDLFHVRLNDKVLEKFNKFISSPSNSQASIQINDGEMVFGYIE